ncbi:unnamed protein product [Brugia timori]|uniref:PDDEXK_1 domain-containing protein n=1 Tax=Brugia timori TaxID=42155 RepID=A0A0R3QF37_9BILA|nr:unnamed protein product [Brugia timori]
MYCPVRYLLKTLRHEFNANNTYLQTGSYLHTQV